MREREKRMNTGKIERRRNGEEIEEDEWLWCEREKRDTVLGETETRRSNGGKEGVVG